MRNTVAHIAGAGLLALDVICEEAAPEALTFAGGTCGNVLSILSYFNWTSEAVGFVGDDPAADRMLSDLMAVGVSAAHVGRTADLRTPVFFQSLQTDDRGRPRHYFSQSCPRCGHDPGGARASTSTPIREFMAAEAPDVFFMDRLSDDILSLASSAKAHGAFVFYEPSSKSDMTHWLHAFDLAHVVKYSADRFEVNEIDRCLAGSSTPTWEIQTRGERGLRYRHRVDRSFDAAWVDCSAIFAPRVVDTCGAGDWCTAGLLHGLISQGMNISTEHFYKAIRLGQALAAWACAFVGARGAMYCRDPASAWSLIRALAQDADIDLSDVPVTSRQSMDGATSPGCAIWLCEER